MWLHIVQAYICRSHGVVVKPAYDSMRDVMYICPGYGTFSYAVRAAVIDLNEAIVFRSSWLGLRMSLQVLMLSCLG